MKDDTSTMAHPAALNEEAFKQLKTSQKTTYLSSVYNDVMKKLNSSQARSGQTQGNAFLWVSLYGKTPLSRAFRAFILKNSKGRIMKNYRGSSNAWYFGSQNDLGVYDSLVELTKELNRYGIPATLCDEWD